MPVLHFTVSEEHIARHRALPKGYTHTKVQEAGLAACEKEVAKKDKTKTKVA